MKMVVRLYKINRQLRRQRGFLFCSYQFLSSIFTKYYTTEHIKYCKIGLNRETLFRKSECGWKFCLLDKFVRCSLILGYRSNIMHGRCTMHIAQSPSLFQPVGLVLHGLHHAKPCKSIPKPQITRLVFAC
jgi:hypothetical protein